VGKKSEGHIITPTMVSPRSDLKESYVGGGKSRVGQGRVLRRAEQSAGQSRKSVEE
jgi:hypothetical protein